MAEKRRSYETVRACDRSVPDTGRSDRRYRLGNTVWPAVTQHCFIGGCHGRRSEMVCSPHLFGI